ncbi:DNA-formamidopyrimidine glycosylase [Texas Phoenix palm phytoplasma]|uniref:DNA-formamidopyrimidine glycosylase n=1 Tax=Texas Phoenix palm phytoplasma TaxID=176709 RepID=A0ABS5BHY4_9MOLU|nr:DNA-formamidopyrimidine glycosylase [Texas Phoenix palm phytoplasma]MBP3059199.1 DNA-formamidopyrimidine glycosylase [Texas Phoenix palm phytoplasma]
MPELPEVEVIVNILKKRLIGLKIKKLFVFYQPIIQELFFFKKIINKKILDVQRKGKFLLFFLSDDLVIVGHLRMEGKIYLHDNYDNLQKHKDEHFRILLEKNIILRYYDFRKFGRFALYKKDNYLKESKLEKLALDPFEIDAKNFYSKLQKTKVSIKTCLLNQRIISGIGNIYANEILFLTRINPKIQSCFLSLQQIIKLLDNAKKILNRAIFCGGTSISTFEAIGKKGSFQKELLVYRKDKEKCIFCSNLIQKIKISGRSSYFCIKCQPLL